MIIVSIARYCFHRSHCTGMSFAYHVMLTWLRRSVFRVLEQKKSSWVTNNFLEVLVFSIAEHFYSLFVFETLQLKIYIECIYLFFSSIYKHLFNEKRKYEKILNMYVQIATFWKRVCICMYIYIYIYIYIRCTILTFVRQCSKHRSRAMYILWEEKDK